MRLLIIGTADLDGSARSSLGGTVISLRGLIDELERHSDLELHVLDIARSKRKNRFVEHMARTISFVSRLIGQVFRVDVVSLHTVSGKLWFTGTVTLVFSRLAGKPVVVRKFGGTDYDSFPFWKKTVTKWVLSRCDVYLAQTMYLVEAAKKRDQIMQCYWFPTHRSMDKTPILRRNRNVCCRFVYIGQVRAYKGIMELVEAAERLNGNVAVDVYGPMFDDLPADLFRDRRRILYRGLLEHQDVISTMRQYDALILPTKAHTEGYPGTIIEAYAAGLPVITTTSGAIPEIVNESNGILVEPGSAEALYLAMKRMSEDSDLYQQLCRGVAERAAQFSAKVWADRFVSYCRELIR